MSWGQFFFSPYGRVRRRDYWLRCVLVFFAVMLLALVLLPPAPLPPPFAQEHPIAAFLGQYFPEVMLGIILLFNVLFVFVGIKRCHDLNLSGWFLLLYFIPWIGNLIIFVMLGFIAGTPSPNRFGPDPKQRAETA